jgi:hypothetical protein
MYLIINKLKFFILLAIVSLWSAEVYAAACKVLETPITLDQNYVKGLEALGNRLSVPVKGKDNLRQTLPYSTITTRFPCTEVHIVNNNGKTLRAIFNNDDLRLQGTIVNNVYYIFKDAKIRVIDGITKDYTTNVVSTYETSQGTILSYENINAAVDVILNARGEETMRINQSLIRIMFITTEALKFRSVSDVSVKLLNKEKTSVSWSDFSASINDWESLSGKALKQGVIPPQNLAKAIGTKNDVQVAKRLS